MAIIKRNGSQSTCRNIVLGKAFFLVFLLGVGFGLCVSFWGYDASTDLTGSLLQFQSDGTTYLRSSSAGGGANSNDIDTTMMWKDVKAKTMKEEKKVCEKVFENTVGMRPIYNENQWKQLRKAYDKIVGADSTITHEVGINFKFEVKQTIYGRGIFALEDVPKGAITYTANNEGKFKDVKQFGKFLDELPAYMACDVIDHWSYVEDGKLVTCMDEGALFNSSDKRRDHNVKTFDGYKDYAIRDIQKGEQILEWYDELFEDQEIEAINFFYSSTSSNGKKKSKSKQKSKSSRQKEKSKTKVE